jgi:type III restriction enzyme
MRRELARLSQVIEIAADASSLPRSMLVTGQTVTAIRKPSKDFSSAFLIVSPGITIRDPLRVLLPTEPDSYYETRETALLKMLQQPPPGDRHHRLPRVAAS